MYNHSKGNSEWSGIELCSTTLGKLPALLKLILLVSMIVQDGALSVRWADEASIMYERATGGLLKNNLLMHFAHADFEEVYINV